MKAYRFGRFRVSEAERSLFADDRRVDLTPKAFDTLLALVHGAGGILTKRQLMATVWPGQFVEENNLAQAIHAVRRALEEGGGTAYVETVPRIGYRFLGNVTVEEPRPFALVPTTHYVRSTGDVSIAYQVVGEGPLDLVFVMGWVSHLEWFWREQSFERFLRRLSTFSRLILFDKRGTGLSDRVPVDELPSLEQRITDVQAVMDAVGSERAALLGISEGGPMCSLFAATWPDRTVATVMIGTYARRIRSDDYPWAPTAEERGHFLEEIRDHWGGPVGLESRAPSMAGDPAFREWWASYLRMGASPSAAVALTEMNARIDVREVLPSVRVPTLVLHRTGDLTLPVEGGRYVASRIPGARFVELPGADHLPFVGDQDAILDEIEEFLTGERPRPDLDRVLTTVVTLLLEGQVSLEPQARRELLRFRGREVAAEPGRLVATFDGPARAVRYAMAIGEAAERAGGRLRAGVHTGECEVFQGRVQGAAVSLSEKVAERATPGETLVSQTVQDLVAGSGIEFRPRSTLRFPGLPGEWRLAAAQP